MSDETTREPSWVFWYKWKLTEKPFPPIDTYCPRCSGYMDGGFWMHLCPDSERYAIRKQSDKKE